MRFCVRHGIHPDPISYFSIVASLIAAVCFWRSGATRWLLIIAPLFCYVRLWLNMLDGLVAFAAGKASRRGEILNDLPDRVSDIMIFVGVAHSGLMNPLIGYWAAIFAVLTSYVGLFGQALGVQRQFAGIMSKPWRMVALHVGADGIGNEVARAVACGIRPSNVNEPGSAARGCWPPTSP